ncbi:MAG: DUF624 domain-containing protein [Lachnospiraceae bacterium]
MNQEFKIINLFSRIIDLLLLNILFVITALPIITLGASITALFSVNLKLVKNEESYIVKDYFHAFCQNFRQATISFVLFFIIIALFTFNILISLHNPGLLSLIFGGFSLMFLVLIGISFLYYFPILARFKFTSLQILKHIPHMIVTQLRFFLLLIVLNIPILFLCMHSIYTLLFVLIAALIIGCSFFAYIESMLFRKIFAPYEMPV